MSDELSTSNDQPDNEHRAKEHKYWTGQTWIGIAAVCISCLALFLAAGSFFTLLATLHATEASVTEAKRQTEIAQAALIASNRAWVDLTTIKVTRLEVKKDQVLVWVDFSFRNIGHSPAQVVSVFPELLIPEVQPWGFKEARRICADIANHPWMLAGNALFPNKDDSLTVNFGRPMKDIIEAQKHFIATTFGQWKRSFGQGEAKDALPTIERMAAYTGFTIAGCISYRFDGSNRIHGTSFAVQLRRRPGHPDVRNGVTSQVFYMGQENTVLGGEMLIVPGLRGKFAN